MQQERSIDLTIDRYFHALSEPLRLKTLELLRDRELCVCELCEILDLAQSKLSFHLKILKEVNLVKVRQQGRWAYYSINLAQLATLEQYLAEYRRFSSIVPSRSCEEFM
jgi:ArsR family transcriptional regulator, arsenate/arsenite/antimonite-responsive transcriptional repressor